MQPAALQRHLAQEDPAPVYLLGGEGRYRIEETWRQLLERLVPERARRLNGERLSAKECTPSQVRERLNTLPMFGGRRLLAVQDLEAWGKEQIKELIEYLEKPNPMACLVLMTGQKKGLEKVEAAVETRGHVVRFPAVSEREAPRWLQERARRLGKTLPAQVAMFLVEQTGADLGLLDREMEKLATFVGDRDRIELEDAKQTASFLRSYTVFEVLRYVSEGELGRAVASLRSLLLGGEEPLIVLALLARHIRIVWQVRDGLDRGLSEEAIGKALKLFPSAMKGYVRQAKAFPQERLYRFHQALCKTDMAMKLSVAPPLTLLEEFVFSLAL